MRIKRLLRVALCVSGLALATAPAQAGHFKWGRGCGHRARATQPCYPQYQHGYPQYQYQASPQGSYAAMPMAPGGYGSGTYGSTGGTSVLNQLIGTVNNNTNRINALEAK